MKILYHKISDKLYCRFPRLLLHLVTFVGALVTFKKTLVIDYMRRFYSYFADNPPALLQDLKLSKNRIYLLDFVSARIHYMDIGKGRLDKLKNIHDYVKQMQHYKSDIYIKYMEIYDNKFRVLGVLDKFKKEVKKEKDDEIFVDKIENEINL